MASPKVKLNSYEPAAGASFGPAGGLFAPLWPSLHMQIDTGPLRPAGEPAVGFRTRRAHAHSHTHTHTQLHLRRTADSEMMPAQKPASARNVDSSPSTKAGPRRPVPPFRSPTSGSGSALFTCSEGDAALTGAVLGSSLRARARIYSNSRFGHQSRRLKIRSRRDSRPNELSRPHIKLHGGRPAGRRAEWRESAELVLEPNSGSQVVVRGSRETLDGRRRPEARLRRSGARFVANSTLAGASSFSRQEGRSSASAQLSPSPLCRRQQALEQVTRRLHARTLVGRGAGAKSNLRAWRGDLSPRRPEGRREL